MGIALLKKLNTCMPDPLKQMAAPVIRAKLIYNTEFQKQFNTLEKAQYSSAADIEKMQFEKLRLFLFMHTSMFHTIIRSLINVDLMSITLKILPKLVKYQH